VESRPKGGRRGACCSSCAFECACLCFRLVLGWCARQRVGTLSFVAGRECASRLNNGYLWRSWGLRLENRTRTNVFAPVPASNANKSVAKSIATERGVGGGTSFRRSECSPRCCRP
ncbi:unnamed protein product, partial [Scytosiphon promiscuus]